MKSDLKAITSHSFDHPPTPAPAPRFIHHPSLHLHVHLQSFQVIHLCSKHHTSPTLLPSPPLYSATMTDTQALFDTARKQFDALATDIERHFDAAAAHLREWIPYDPRTQTISLSPPPRRLPPPTTLQVVQRWISRHRALTAGIVAFVLTGGVGVGVYAYRYGGFAGMRKRKRRAKKSASGARTDVVVVAGGAVANPVSSGLYLDLERRGFVVYVVVQTNEEEQYIRSQNRADLLPLHVDLLDPFTAQEQMARFKNLLEREHRAFEGAAPHRLKFCGLVLVPDTQTSPARIEDVSSEEWSDALNARVLNTIATTQLFLPALQDHGAKVLLLTDSVIPTLRMPGHGVQSTIYGALEAFISSLRAEVQDEGVSVAHFKLGSIDVPSLTAKQRREGLPAPRLKATPQRRLHDAVFDALVASRPRRTWYVGRGSLAYDIVGSWMPAGAVGWLMGAGLRRRGGLSEQVPAEEGLAGSQGSLEWEKIEEDR